jgi:undecaprenyl-diphosphatase
LDIPTLRQGVFVIVEAALLGIVQGLTEFIPVSSSAHLVAIPYLSGWQSPLLRSLTFDVALHLGTFLAVVGYFFRELIAGVRGALQFLRSRGREITPDLKMWMMILLATLPILAAAILLRDWIEGVFRSPLSIAAALILAGLIMAGADRFAKSQKEISALGWRDALLMGLAQCAALAPGVSRSGALLIVGLLLGYRREAAARFAFLLSIPTIAAATVYESRVLWQGKITGHEWVSIGVGIFFAGAVGFLCVAWLLRFLQRRGLALFVGYRLVLGAVLIAWWFLAAQQ